jgi:hypothetical protein|tara:strand:+ start:2478 stop:2933 length:456 start_codon:yes stop_codon:yes gene_type:complete
MKTIKTLILILLCGVFAQAVVPTIAEADFRDQITEALQQPALFGYYSDNVTGPATIQIKRSMTGTYALHIHDGEVWLKLTDLKKSSRSQIRSQFADVSSSVKEGLYFGQPSAPSIAFYYIEAGQFGTTYLKEPMYLMYTTGQAAPLRKVSK